MSSTNNRRADVGVFDSLTERENEILACLVHGMSNREVSDRLNLAVTTVKWYTRQIYNKLGVNSRREAVALAKDYGLFQLSVTQSTKIRHNLPAETTPFIGRKREIDTVTNLLEQPKHRLLTILAPGGMGKSRLAMQIGRIHPDRFADGIYFVALQSLSASEQIVVTIGESIGFVFVPGERSPEQQLLDFLKNKEMLLILDNFEHLLAGTTYVTDILRTAPQIKILTTSRQSLNLTSETVLKLNGLAYERDGDSSDAADLFVDAVRQLSPTFQGADQFQETIDRICQLTEGMPLALLLAAAWSDTLTLAQIADEIEAGIGFLEQTKSDLPLRHRGIRAVFEPTWQRLTESERLVLARFSVFAGGCTYEAATQVAKATPAILQSLVNKALIIRTSSGRYEMHELLRQYANERLEELDLFVATKDAHAEYYRDLLSQQEAHLKGNNQNESLKLIDAEFSNVRSAWGYKVSINDLEAFMISLESLRLYFLMRSRLVDGRSLSENAIHALHWEGKQQTLLALQLLSIWMRSDTFTSEFRPEDLDSVQALIALAKKHHDTSTLALGYMTQGILYSHNSEYDHALDLLHEAQTIYKTIGDNYNHAFALRSQCLPAMFTGQIERAHDLANKAYSLSDAIGDLRGSAEALYLKTIQEHNDGSNTNVENMLQVVKMHEDLGEGRGLSISLGAAGMIAWMHSNYALARSLYIRCWEQFERSGLLDGLLSATIVRALIHITDEEPNKALYLSLHALPICTNLTYFEPIRWCHAIARVNQGQYQMALPSIYFSMQQIIAAEFISILVKMLALAIILLCEDNKYIFASELAGAILQHSPYPQSWLTSWQPLSAALNRARATLGDDLYAAAMKNGAGQDLFVLAKSTLSELETWDWREIPTYSEQLQIEYNEHTHNKLALKEKLIAFHRKNLNTLDGQEFQH